MSVGAGAAPNWFMMAIVDWQEEGLVFPVGSGHGGPCIA